MNDNKIIAKTAQETAERIVSELKRQGLIKNQKQTAFQKTEILLYNYNSFLEAVNDKERQIEEILTAGIKKKSGSITSFSANSSYENTPETEKADERIEIIKESIKTTKTFLKLIDDAITKIKNDPYFDIIKLKYFEGKSREEIADYFGVDATTISRNKNRIIGMLKIKLFSDDVILQMLNN